MKTQSSILRYLGWNTQGDLGPWTFYTSKRKGLVWFIKAPPLEPPSPMQIHQRNKFRLVAATWRSLSAEQRNNWSLAARRAHLQITGYNLFTYYLTRNDPAVVRTIEQQSRVDLLPLTRSLT